MTFYVLDPTGLIQVLAETTGGQTRQYLPGLAQYEAGAWAYPLPDGLGSVRQMVNSARQLTLMQNYDPFGNPTQMVGASPFGYTGEQVDSTGLVYLRARYYSPPVGRFLTADSIIPDPLKSQAWNRYAYVENNPIRYTDPSGHCFFAGVDTAACITAVAVGLTLTGVMLTANASEPLPPDEVPSAEQGIIGMGLLFSGGTLALAPELLVPGGSICSQACADGDCTKEINTGGTTARQMVERFGLKFTENYYYRLWETGRKSPGLIANEILEAGHFKPIPVQVASRPGEQFFLYRAFSGSGQTGWELVYNPTTKEVYHLQPIQDVTTKIIMAWR